MPDVATAPTASAAQTAAAGSRMIGFYLGAGGVKVDCLFDTANFVTKDAAGNVGIGTAAPGARLQVAGVGGSSVISLLETGVRNWAIRSGGAASNIFDIADLTAGATRLAINSAGNVGIGTTAPGVKLEVANGDQSLSRVRIRNTGAGGQAWDLMAGLHNASQSNFSLYCADTDTTALTATSGGAVGIGTTSPQLRLHVKTNGEITRFETTTVRGGGSSFLSFYDPTGRKGFFGFGGVADAFVVANEMNEPVVINTNGNNRWMFEAGGNFRPYNDNGYSVGVAANRISVVYAGTGTINTSDERLKVWIGRATEDRVAKDRRIARAILDELGWYQFTDAVTEKGPDGARWHFGARAQRIWQIVADEGLAPPLVDVEGILLPDITWTGPVAPAWLCFDGWNDQFEDVYQDVVHVDELQVGEEGTGEFGPDGAEIMRPVTEEVERIEREPTGERQLVREAGHLFGFRVDEMNLLLSWALHDRLSALEAAA